MNEMQDNDLVFVLADDVPAVLEQVRELSPAPAQLMTRMTTAGSVGRDPHDDASRDARREFLVAAAGDADGPRRRRVRGHLVGRRAGLHRRAAVARCRDSRSIAAASASAAGSSSGSGDGTYAPHIIEHVALELQTMIGHDVGYGRTRGGDVEGEYTLVFEHVHEQWDSAPRRSRWRRCSRRSPERFTSVDHAVAELVRARRDARRSAAARSMCCAESPAGPTAPQRATRSSAEAFGKATS